MLRQGVSDEDGAKVCWGAIFSGCGKMVRLSGMAIDQ